MNEDLLEWIMNIQSMHNDVTDQMKTVFKENVAEYYLEELKFDLQDAEIALREAQIEVNHLKSKLARTEALLGE